MTTSKCERAWQAEALEDGRLGDEGRASFERHVEGCTDCRDEARALRLLRARSTALATRELSELEHRRQRDKLLTAANETLVGSRARRPFAIVAVAAVLLLAAIGLRSIRRHATAPPHYSIVDLGAAKTTILDPGISTRIALNAGTARFEVAHLSPEQRFFVTLPDGEIEVRGTEFLVRVAGATEEVRVESGLIALRIGGVERFLGAGMTWKPDANSPIVVTSAPSVAAPGVVSEGPSVMPSASVASSVHSAKTASAFAEAMTAFHAADYARAERLFAEFSSTHRSDARVEDAAFLRAVCASRIGETSRAAALARSYLEAYPAGFHASDARKLASP